jgi:hypothetical protein
MVSESLSWRSAKGVGGGKGRMERLDEPGDLNDILSMGNANCTSKCFSTRVRNRKVLRTRPCRVIINKMTDYVEDMFTPAVDSEIEKCSKE